MVAGNAILVDDAGNILRPGNPRGVESVRTQENSSAKRRKEKQKKCAPHTGNSNSPMMQVKLLASRAFLRLV
jgi:hypothetical protein